MSADRAHPRSGVVRSLVLRDWPVLRAIFLSTFIAGAALAADVETAQVTIVDGDATLVVAARKSAAVAGQRVDARTLIETGPELKLLRVEWPDGSAVDFGPGTRAMLTPGRFGPRLRAHPAFYLLEGWAKQSGLGTEAVAGHVTAALQIHPFKGITVTHVGEQGSFVFVESGTVDLIERSSRPPVVMSLKSGEVYSRDKTGNGATASRPSTEQLRSVPRGFRDTLPLRGAKLAGKEVELKLLPPPAYAELSPWLTAEWALRRDFPRRFGAFARETTFRKALEDNLRAHPEWESVLYPEKQQRP